MTVLVINVYSELQRSSHSNLEVLLRDNALRQILHCFSCLLQMTTGHSALHELCSPLRQRIRGMSFLRNKFDDEILGGSLDRGSNYGGVVFYFLRGAISGKWSEIELRLQLSVIGNHYMGF